MKTKTFYFLTLGCPKNTVDSEVMAGFLMEKGYKPVSSLDSFVDVVIINTCGFIEPSKEESIERIFQFVELKNNKKIGKLVVVGCLTQRYFKQLKKEIPEIDMIGGINHIEKIVELVEKDTLQLNFDNPYYIYSHGSPRAISTGKAYAYIKIADGCNHKCGFCAIPGIRGNLRSRTVESIIIEAKNLINRGYKELILISQDSTSYGTDLGLKDGLTELLLQLDKLDFDGFIRPMYLFPGKISDKLLEVIGGSETICSYFDIPLQHSSKKILKRMQRPFDGEEYLKLIERIRGKVHDAFIRTALIVGFPGEEKEDFENLKAFVKAAGFNHLGVFSYSHEEGTPAEKYQDTVAFETKQERMAEIMEIQKEISYHINSSFIGKELKVIVEGYSRETELLLQGRHMGQAPEIDGIVFINDGEAKAGEIRSVKIEQAMHYDILGKLID
jgi:ribosomal protein S12 methylthiotransferase